MTSNYEAGRYAAFLTACPGYADTARLDELRAREYSRLDAMGQVYLDYTGGGLFADSQLDEHLRLLRAAHARRQVLREAPVA